MTSRASSSPTGILVRLVVLVTALTLGGLLVWQFMRSTPVVETPAPEIVQNDGSKVIPRAPDAKAKPKHRIQKGAKLERTMQFEVRGAGLKFPDGEIMPCPPVTVDLSLVREPDGGKRVVASSPDGEIIKAIDVPIETAATPSEPKQWAAGLSWSPTSQTAGVWIERDVMRFRVGAEINQVRQQAYGPSGTEARVRIGCTF